MATRSVIGMKAKDGSLRVIYCHWDGYLDHHGLILFRSYDTPDKVNALLDLGDLSNLRNNIGEKHDISALAQDAHKFSEEHDWCDSYGRDRGDEGTEAKNFSTIKEMMDYAKEVWVDYAYLYDANTRKWEFTSLHDGEWLDVYKALLDAGYIDPLEDLMVEAKKETA